MVVWRVKANGKQLLGKLGSLSYDMTYACIRQHTSAYVSIRQHTNLLGKLGSLRHDLDVEGKDEREVLHTSAYVSIRQHTSAYVSIRQHTSAYVNIEPGVSRALCRRE